MRAFVAPFALVLGLLSANLAPAQELQSAKPEEAGFSSERLDRVTQLLRDDIGKGLIPGAVLLVARHGKVVYFESVGTLNPATKAPMTKDAIFRIFSMSKPVTSVSAMMLVEEGKLELRRNVEDYLPEFKGIQVEENGMGPNRQHAPAHPPTVWQLMSHTSGLGPDPEGELHDNPRTMRVPLADAVRFYGHQHLLFEPGSRWSYSNMGIATLGRIVEVVSGEDYVHFVTAHILNPLGMKNTFFFAAPDQRERVALVYTLVNCKLVRTEADILDGHPANHCE